MIDYLHNAFRGKRYYLFAILTGAVGGLGFAPFHWMPFAALAYGGVFAMLYYDQTPAYWRSFAGGWLWGISLFISGLWWTGNALLVSNNPYLWALPLAVAGLPALLAFFPAFASLLYRIFTRKTLPSPLLAVVAWAVFLSFSEWARGHWFTGFPWNLPAYNWSFSLSVLQILSVIGPYFLTFLTLLFYGFLVLICFERIKKPAVIVTSLFLLMFAGFWSGGALRLDANPTAFTRHAVRVVQPNIPQAEKWDGATYDAQVAKMADLIAQETAFSKAEAPDSLLTVLPETAMNEEMVASPIGTDRLTAAFAALDKRAYPNFVYTGYLRSDIVPDGADFKRVYFNSSLLLDSRRSIVAVFNKFHLVPFGEYMPLDEYLPISQFVKFSGFQAGHGLETLIAPPLPNFGPLICYEVLFPGHVIDPKATRPDVLVNITNDAWYGDAPGPYQHMLMAQYRAIEEGIPVIRSANTGISVITDSVGRILAKEKLGRTALIEGYIPTVFQGRTPYSQFGEFPYFIFIFICLVTISLKAHRKSKAHT